MGGLAKRMPWTSRAFLLGVLAICGVTFTSGFFSKDAMLVAAYDANLPVFAMLLAGALLTAFYMGRLYWLIFHGQARSKAAETAKENEPVIVYPLLVLALCATFGGFVALWPEQLGSVFHSELEATHDSRGHLFVMTFATLAWVLGLWGSWILYRRSKGIEPLEESYPGFLRLCESRLFFDEVYDCCVTRPVRRIARILEAMELLLISGLMVRGTAGIIALFGLAFAVVHRGGFRTYALCFVTGLIAFLAYAGGWLEL